MSEFNWTPDELQKIVEENSVVLFMKGTPEAPQCGFSNRAASVVSQLGVPFASVNVLSDARARNALALSLNRQAQENVLSARRVATLESHPNWHSAEAWELQSRFFQTG